MHTSNEIVILGDPEKIKPRIYQLAAEIEHWAQLLPHYRYLNVTERTGNVNRANYGASRDGFPVKWRAEQEVFPEERRVTFRHIGGVSKGMWVEWRLHPHPEGVRVTISHELDYPVPIVGAWFAKYIVGRVFVENIANKTLGCFKTIIERELREGNGQREG